jgi:multiple sugar transport system permease protein
VPGAPPLCNVPKPGTRRTKEYFCRDEHMQKNELHALPVPMAATDQGQGVLGQFGRFVDRTFKVWALFPMLVVLLSLTIYPAIQLVRMSVSDVRFEEGRLVWEYVGLEAVQRMAEDPVVATAIRNTLVFVVAAVTLETLLGLVLALLVSRVRHLSRFYRAVLVIPILIPPIAISVMWRLMYDYNYGVINQLLGMVGIPGLLWTADPNLAMPSVIIVDIWHWTSFLFLIMLAGVESLPIELTEAARVDGATELQTYRYVIIPLLRPTIIVAVMLRTILAFKVFDQIFALTGGGPGTATQIISLHIYNVFFVQFRLGYGAFLALVMAALISVFVVFYRWLGRVVQRSL